MISIPPLLAETDIRGTPEYRATEDWFRALWEPGFGAPFDPVDLALSPDQSEVVFAAEVREDLSGVAPSRIWVLDLRSGSVQALSSGPGSERAPSWSVDGSLVAFLADEPDGAGTQVRYRAMQQGRVTEAPRVEGTAEYARWSPSGHRLLVGVAAMAAEQSGELGSRPLLAKASEGWLPQVDAGDTPSKGRSAWVLDLSSGRLRRISPQSVCVWESTWISEDVVAVLFSEGVSEGAWYHAEIGLLNLGDGSLRPVFGSGLQLRLMEGSPDGRHLAFLEALASDRGTVAGDLVVLDVDSGASRVLDALGTDVTWAQWRDDRRIVFAGHRGQETLVGEVGLEGGSRVIWAGLETSGRTYPSAVPVGQEAALMVMESWSDPPAIVRVESGDVALLAEFGHAGTRFLGQCGGEIEQVSWIGRDGVEIHGWLVGGDDRTTRPAILEIHGGPTWAARNRWSARNLVLPLMAAAGYRILMPNFRGSVGWGHGFASMILGDMGGEDLFDCLGGIDLLVGEGLADPKRLGVLGGSYGGFAASLIIARTNRFGAAVALSPVTDWFSQHGSSNIGAFDRLFLGADPLQADGPYQERSPARSGRAVSTPLLTVAGGKDRCTPPHQAWQMHSAVLEGGNAPSVVVVYPEEGHGVRGYPAIIDYCARVRHWFSELIPVGPSAVG